MRRARRRPAHRWVDDEHHADELREVLRAAAAALRAALALGRLLAEVRVREPQRLFVATREQPRALEEAARLEGEWPSELRAAELRGRIARVYREVVVEGGPAAHAADEEEQAAARREEPAREEEDAAEGAVQRR